jgi:hypothetical protein
LRWQQIRLQVLIRVLHQEVNQSCAMSVRTQPHAGQLRYHVGFTSIVITFSAAAVIRNLQQSFLLCQRKHSMNRIFPNFAHSTKLVI